ncbi:MAG: retroviral-like aspartic protease family protein [Candidatus Aenigmarchaeota archaeon]|nr:retroviral-like aspartic protease family protein [Candidatus Aenigmarchaeota archaeon]
MRIRLETDEFLMPSLIGTIRSKKYHIYGFVKFIVDTGSNYTDIGERDALRLNIPFNRIKKLEESTRLGGTKWNDYELKDVSLVVKDENGNRVELTFDSIGVRKCSKSKNVEMERAMEMPSIIGNDFLHKNKLALYHDPFRKVSYLERI